MVSPLLALTERSKTSAVSPKLFHNHRETSTNQKGYRSHTIRLSPSNTRWCDHDCREPPLANHHCCTGPSKPLPGKTCHFCASHRATSRVAIASHYEDTYHATTFLYINKRPHLKCMTYKNKNLSQFYMKLFLFVKVNFYQIYFFITFC
jgi:hypothetical protein